MSIAVSDIVAGAYQLLGRPSQLDLPYKDVVNNARDVVRGFILDLKLSARDHKTTFTAWITPNAREMDVLDFTGHIGLDSFLPTKMEWRYAASASQDPIPFKVEFVSYEQLYDLAAKSRRDTETYVALYNDNTKMAFSETFTILLQRQYRMSYESLNDETITALNQNAALPALFITYCKYKTAEISLDQVENTSDVWMEKRGRLRPAIQQGINEWEPRKKQFVFTLYGNKQTKKLGYRPRMRR